MKPTPRRIVRGARAALVVAGIALAGGCLGPPERHPVPAELVETARVPGYAQIRFWGDENTPSFDAAMTAQYKDVRAAAEAGKLPGALKTATFLSISGGGDKGAFAAGLLEGWSESGTRPNFESVTGVSTGALAAPFAFLGPAYDHVLKEIYTETEADQLYDNRWFYGLFGDAVKGTGPLRGLIEHYATDAVLDDIAAQYRLGRRLLVSTTNLDAQRPVIWDLSAVAASGRPDRRKLFTDVLLASSAVPGVFPPVKITVVGADGKTYDELQVDGGATSQMIFLPPEVTLYKSESKVFDAPRDRTLYVVRNGKLAPEYKPTPEAAIEIMQRGVSTLVKYQVVSNMQLLQRAAQAGHTAFRFEAIPATFDAVALGKFDRVYAEKLYAQGRDVGLKDSWLSDVPNSPELAR